MSARRLSPDVNLDTYLVTDAEHSPGRSTVDVVEAAVAGGVDVVQLREKPASARDRYRLGRELGELTRAADVTFLVNDRVDIAAAVDADGVHLGDDDLPVSVAREQLGDDAVVGRSVSTPVSRHSAATVDSAVSVRAASTTSAPSAANRRAVAAPMPELAPVTSATRPANSSVIAAFGRRQPPRLAPPSPPRGRRRP